MAISANGYIAKEDNSTSWISKDDWESFNKISKEIGCIAIGRKTYEAMKDEKSFLKGPTYFVLTSKNILSSNSNVIIFTGGPKSLLAKIEDMGFNSVCVAGGGKLNTAFIEKSLVNEIYLDIEPIILGRGINLFFPLNFEVNLKLMDFKKLNESTIQVHYSVLQNL